jgi:hypothetical protein
MPDNTAKAKRPQESAAIFTSDLMKMSQELAIAEIERFYAAADPIHFEPLPCEDAGQISRKR